MTESVMNIALLDKVIQSTVQSVTSSKQQIFEISEAAREEANKLKQDLFRVLREVEETIKRVDLLENISRKSRMHLAHVSKNFNQFSDEDIRKAYEAANEQQLQLYMERQKEQNLREKRDDLTIRLKGLEKTVERAESLLSQLSVTFEVLTGNLSKVSEVLESAQTKQKLGLQLIQAQEEERKRVARDIHDGPAQSIANVILRTEFVERSLQKGEVQLALHELKHSKEMLRASLTEVRQIIFDLRPMVLDDLGLIPTLKKYIEQFSIKTGIMTELTSFGVETRLSNSLEVALFRLVQEALTNVQKHSSAKSVHIKIEFKPHHITLIIQDNGKGFEWPIQMNTSRDFHSFGLLGMQERVEWLEGKLEIDSKPGRGTKVIFNVPITK